MEYNIGSVVFNDWIITKELGEGATGRVFEIEKNGFGQSIRSALKVIRIPKTESDVYTVMSEGMDEESVTEYFQEFVDEILHEIEIMVSLKEHPNIVTYEDHCVNMHEDGIGWDILIKMELLTSLTEWQMSHVMTEKMIIKLGCEISSALAYARERKLIHRDVKPENIFVDSLGRFKLGDFGIARTIEKTMGGLSKKGTESYMAPEVYLGKKYNEQVDIYSLGIVLYRFMNNNRFPFYPPAPEAIGYRTREEALMKRIQGLPLPEPQTGSPELKRIVLKACEYIPEKRYASMNELHNELQKIVIDDTPEGKNEHDPDRKEKKKGKTKKWIIAGLAVICILAGVAGGMHLKKEEKNGYTVAIDPGHTGCIPDVTKKVAIGPGSSEIVDAFTSYGKDGTGAIGKYLGTRECDVNLGVGLELNDILISRGYNVVLLRSDNHTETSIQERTVQANDSDADILIHIYCRKDYNRENRGGMVYIPSSENPYVSNMYEQCNKLGNTILYNYCKTTGYENAGIFYKDTDIGINWSEKPVASVMLGLIYDSVDEARLADSANWTTMAEGIANGIDEYFLELE